MIVADQKVREDALSVMWALARFGRKCNCCECHWKRAQLDAFYEKVWEVLFFEEVDGVS